eukprot:TRINITY_DN763_c0_g1_i4.p1 TRINITY_DN763_c0_g1~~TRINITY_DN763_c0_g1_i4.p1  ORF type:complete len:202 (+),score=52.14 TRINITY_DN763_c0_g1_i4:274-879(+)
MLSVDFLRDGATFLALIPLFLLLSFPTRASDPKQKTQRMSRHGQRRLKTRSSYVDESLFQSNTPYGSQKENNFAVLSINDVRRIQTELSDMDGTADQKRAEAMREESVMRSRKRVEQWNNTIKAQRKKKDERIHKRKEEQEEKRRELDREEEEIQAKIREEQIERGTSQHHLFFSLPTTTTTRFLSQHPHFSVVHAQWTFL